MTSTGRRLGWAFLLAILLSGGLAAQNPVSIQQIGSTAITDYTPDQTLDFDTGAGTVTQVVYGVALPGSGGPVAGGTSTNPIAVRTIDPCTALLPTTVAVSQTADTQLITGTANKKTYICGGVLVAGAAEIINLVEGTGSVCGTSTTALVGSTTEANGVSLAANGVLPIDTPISGSGTAVNTCLYNNTASRVSGYVTYVQQ